MDGLVRRNAFSTTGRAVRRTLAGCLPQTRIAEPDRADVARLALATVALPVWIAAAALTARILGGGSDVPAALAVLSTLFVMQTLGVVPILAVMRRSRRLLAIGGNGALLDYALLLHLSAGVAIALASGNAGGAGYAMHHGATFAIGLAVFAGAILRGIRAASMLAVALGVFVSAVPSVVVFLSRTATALLLHVADFPGSAYDAARLVNNSLPGA